MKIGKILITSGTVNATGAGEGNGIGYNSVENTIITGGIVNATGGNAGGTGIGGKNVVITGGDITVSGSGGGIGIGTDEDGCAVTVLSDVTCSDGECYGNVTSSMILTGDTIVVTGDHTITADYKIPAGVTINVPTGASLGIAEDVTLDGVSIVVGGTEYNGSLEAGTVIRTAEITEASVTIGTDLTMNYRIRLYDASLVNGNQKLAVQFTMGEIETMADATASGEYYICSFTGIGPQCMADNINAKLVAVDTETAEVVILDELDYSVKKYAQALLTENQDNEELVHLVTDMLYYGKAAQDFMSYNTGAYATADVTGMAAQAADVPANTNKTITASEGDINFASANVWFGNVNKIRVKLSDTANAKVVIKLGEEIVANHENLTSKYVYTDAISATGFDTVYTFELYENDTLVQTLTYSISSYVYSMKDNANDNMATLATALYNYGKSAVAYAN